MTNPDPRPVTTRGPLRLDFSGAPAQAGAPQVGTDLRAASNLTAQQLRGARMDDTTLLPPGMSRPAVAPSLR